MPEAARIDVTESRLGRILKGRAHLASLPAAQVWLQTLTDGTARAYGRDVDTWVGYLADRFGIGVPEATAHHMETWIADQQSDGAPDSTIARRYAAVRGFYAWARREVPGFAGDISVARGRAPKVHSDATQKLGLDRDHTREVLKAAEHYGPRAVALVTMLAVCGLRVSEALLADVDDIREQRGHRTVTVMGKGRKPRTVVLPPRVWHAIDTYLDGRESGPIFVTSTGRRMDRQAAHDSIRRIGKRAGVDLHPHLLRHTAATAALDAGAPLDQVQDLLGHSSPVITKRYVAARQRLDSSAAYAVASWLDE